MSREICKYRWGFINVALEYYILRKIISSQTFLSVDLPR